MSPDIEEVELNRMIFRGFPENGLRRCFIKLVRHPLRYHSVRSAYTPEPTIGMQHCSVMATFVRGRHHDVESVQVFRGMPDADGRLVPYSQFGERDEMKYWQADYVGSIRSSIYSVRSGAIEHPLNGQRYHPVYCNDWLWAKQFVAIVSNGMLSIDHLCPIHKERDQRSQ